MKLCGLCCLKSCLVCAEIRRRLLFLREHGEGVTWRPDRQLGKVGVALWLDSAGWYREVTGPDPYCEVCERIVILGGVCRLHLRHSSGKRGWRRAMGLQRLRERASGLNGTGASSVNSEDEGFKKEMPTLWAFVTQTEWEDGSSRETGTIFIFREAGTWRACLNDRDSGHVGFVSCDTFKGLWKAVEKQLAEERVDWRLSRQARQTGRKRP